MAKKVIENLVCVVMFYKMTTYGTALRCEQITMRAGSNRTRFDPFCWHQ